MGGTAVLLADNLNEMKVNRFAISPAVFHFNGSSGIKCAFPGKYWKNHDNYQTFFETSLLGMFDLLLYKLKIIDQRQVIENTIKDFTIKDLDEISLLETLPKDTKIYFGTDDEQLPSEIMYSYLCKSGKICNLFEGAGHSLLYTSLHGFCVSHELSFSENCTSSRKAQLHILDEILEALESN